MSAAEQTLGQISTKLTQKEDKENQLVEWGKTTEVYGNWENQPRTVEMKKIAEAFELPQMQERLSNIGQVIQQQQQSGQGNLMPNQQQRQQGKHR